MNAATFEERRFPARAMMARCFSDACSSLPRTHSTTQRLSVCHSHCHCQSVNSTLPSPTHPRSLYWKHREAGFLVLCQFVVALISASLPPSASALLSRLQVQHRSSAFRPEFCCVSPHPSSLPSCGAGALGRGRCSFIHSFSSSPHCRWPLTRLCSTAASLLTQLTPHLSFVAVGGAGRRLQFTRLLFPPLTRLSSTPSPSFVLPLSTAAPPNQYSSPARALTILPARPSASCSSPPWPAPLQSWNECYMSKFSNRTKY